jgi:hypothetical protein
MRDLAPEVETTVDPLSTLACGRARSGRARPNPSRPSVDVRRREPQSPRMKKLMHLAPLLAACATAPRALEEGQLPRGPTALADVDGDGLTDRVYLFPDLNHPAPDGPDALLTRLADLPPAVVAHALPGGRFTFDDPISRAALRALCPEAPPVRAWEEPDEAPDPDSRQPFLEVLLLDGFCRRVWGDSPEAAIAHVEASMAASHPSRFAPAARDALASAIRELFVPRQLGPLSPVRWPVWPARPEAREVPQPGEPPSTAARCAPVEAEWEAARQRVDALVAPIQLPDAAVPVTLDARFQSCVDTERGLWLIRPGEARVEPREEGAPVFVQLPVTLTWQPHDGAPASVDTSWSLSEMGDMFQSIGPAFDLDGDGTPELFVKDETWHFEGGETARMTIYSVKNGVVVPYASAPNARAPEAVEDIDRDGRPDLVLPSPWAFSDRCGLYGDLHPAPRPAARSRPDGSFSLNDPQTRAWLSSQCYARDPGTAADARDIACARIAGLDPERIVATLHAERPVGPQRLLGADLDERCLTFQELALTALIGLDAE